VIRWPWSRPSIRKCSCHGVEKSDSLLLAPGEYRYIGKELLGVTLSWGATPVPYERSTWECKECGRQFHRQGYLPAKLWHKDYPPDANGWPTLNGKQIEIADL